MVITTPIIYLVLFVVGALVVLRQIYARVKKRRIYDGRNQLTDITALALFFGPILAIILKQSVVYNG